MSEFQLEVIDRGGWRQAVTLRKALSHIGSDPRNDVVLDAGRGRGVAPRHLQLLVGPGRPAPRLVNLGETVTVAGALGERQVPAHAVVDLAGGDRIKIGEFTLVVGRLVGTGSLAAQVPAQSTAVPVPVPTSAAGGPTAAPLATSPPAGVPSLAGAAHGLGLELRLPDSTLTPEQPLEGVLVVQNLGDRAGVQFRIAVEGFPAECIEVGPAPILFPNAQKEVFFRLRHPRGPALLAGRQRFRVVVTAPEAYPGEIAAATKSVQVQAFYHHQVTVKPAD
jgi:hypothetical protein